MKIDNSMALISAIKSEWIAVDKNTFDKVFREKDLTDRINVDSKDVWIVGLNPYLMFCHKEKIYYVEESIYEDYKPKRLEFILSNGSVYQFRMDR